MANMDPMRHSSHLSRTILVGVLWLLSAVLPTAELVAEPLRGWTIQGFAALRASRVESAASWLAGGFGALPHDAEAQNDLQAPVDDISLAGQLHLVLRWSSPRERFGAHVHVAGREEPDGLRGSDLGLVEAYFRGDFPFRDADVLRFKVGHFLLPTSRENIEVGWASPYTLSFSALNQWIGEEIRPTGVQLEYTAAVGAIDEVRVGGSLFGDNDTAGTLLAWRGWIPGDRLTLFGEVLPLPPLRGFMPRAGFAAQHRGTQPFTEDLDGRLGWAGWLRWQRPGKAVVQYTHYDNRSDRRLHDGPGYQYAWRTDFDLLAAQWNPRHDVVLAAEWMRGATGMGDRSGPAFVDADFEAAYALVSWNPRNFRLSARWETFETVDRDQGQAYDNNDGDGDALTLAFFWNARTNLRLGLEYLDLDTARPVAATLGADPEVGGEMLSLELRYYLDFF